MLAYRIELEPDDNDTFLVTCPDLPGVVTYGETREEARAHAVDAIETMIASLMADGEPVPPPTAAAGDGRDLVRLPALTTLKVNLYWSLQCAGITRAELARRLKWNRESVDRLFRLDHASRLEQIEAAFAALGQEVDVTVKERKAA